MILECYFDDSSDARREKYYACGGLIGSPAQWDRFDILWNTETKGLSKPFHATECECGYGQFKNWPKTRRDDLMARLTSVVRQLRLYGYASIVPVTAFKEVFPLLKEHEAFHVAIAHVAVNMAHIADRGNMDVAIWFENGSHGGAAMDIVDSLKKTAWKPAQRLKGPYFGPKELRPLQSADLIAREAFKHIDNLGVRPMRKPLIQLSEKLFFMLWNKGTLEHFAANGGPKNLQAMYTSADIPDVAKLNHFWKKSWGINEKTK
ncbi:MAG: hypothetical protein LAN84_13470 [Acidobacteriia bacterium]|nr:hypothetical protein [Terriglobia bacterium]